MVAEEKDEGVVAKLGPGCFVWDSREDGILGSGMFYRRDMVTNHLVDFRALQ